MKQNMFYSSSLSTFNNNNVILTCISHLICCLISAVCVASKTYKFMPSFLDMVKNKNKFDCHKENTMQTAVFGLKQ